MLPPRNSRPQRPSQFQTKGTGPSAPPQVMGNPGSFMQIQPQMPIPNNNNNPNALLAFQMNQMNNSQQKGQFLPQNIVNPTQFLNQNVGFGGFPNPMQNLNQLLQMQMAMQMASYAQAVTPGGLPFYPNQVSQGMGIQNSNIAMNGTAQQLMNGNLSKQMANANQQLQGQSPVMNSFGIVQQPQTQNFNAPASANTQFSQGMGPQSSNFGMNASLGLVNTNIAVQQSKNGLSKQIPNVNQQFQGQLPLMNSFGFVQQPQNQNFNAPASANTQVCQGMGPPISNFAMNAHLGLLNTNGAIQQMPNVNQQLLGPLPLMNPFGIVQQPQTQNFNALASTNTQGNPGCDVGLNPSKGNQQNSYNSNFSRNQKHGAKKSKFGKGKFSTHNKGQEKGHHRNGEKKNILTNSVKPEIEKKRPLLVTYSAQEIRQWREERRKNYPSKANIEKQLTEKMVESEDSSCAAKLRRQQLKEILAKQAELGFEVAEIPSAYLSDTEKQVDGREQRRPLRKKERFQKRFNKRDKFNRNDRFSKKRRFGNSDSSNTCDQKGDVNRESVTQVTKNSREPTLLQKLLSSDIRRDKRRLLQVFRFMTMNSFFQDWPKKPFRFPQVLLKETGKEIEAAEEIYDAIDTTIEKSSDDDDDDNEDEENIAEFTEVGGELKENSNSESDEPEEQQTTD